MPRTQSEHAGTDEDRLRVIVAEELASLLGTVGTPQDGANMSRIERLAAACDSINYLNAKAPHCPRYSHALELLNAGMAIRRSEGLVLEFGVFSGRTVNHLASLTPGAVYGFDSFEGLPEDWRPDVLEGTFRSASLPETRSNVELIVGWFEDTLPRFVIAHPEAVSLLHIDCDLYSSTKTIFYYLAKKIVSGTVIVFDEYLNYIGWRVHEYKAFQEFISASGHSYRYIGFVPAYQQVAVQIL